jgi:hypothetical protein
MHLKCPPLREPAERIENAPARRRRWAQVLDATGAVPRSPLWQVAGRRELTIQSHFLLENSLNGRRSALRQHGIESDYGRLAFFNHGIHSVCGNFGKLHDGICSTGGRRDFFHLGISFNYGRASHFHDGIEVQRGNSAFFQHGIEAEKRRK